MITFWAKLEQGQGSRTRLKIRIDVSRCFAAMSNRCWHLTNEFTNFTAHGRCDRAHNFTLIYRVHLANTFRRLMIIKQFYFYLSRLYNIFQQPSYIPSFVCSFTAPSLLAMATPLRKTCSGGGII